MSISDEEPIVHEVEEITPEVLEDAGEEALETNRVIVGYEDKEKESTDE